MQARGREAGGGPDDADPRKSAAAKKKKKKPKRKGETESDAADGVGRPNGPTDAESDAGRHQPDARRQEAVEIMNGMRRSALVSTHACSHAHIHDTQLAWCMQGTSRALAAAPPSSSNTASTRYRAMNV